MVLTHEYLENSYFFKVFFSRTNSFSSIWGTKYLQKWVFVDTSSIKVLQFLFNNNAKGYSWVFVSVIQQPVHVGIIRSRFAFPPRRSWVFAYLTNTICISV